MLNPEGGYSGSYRMGGGDSDSLLTINLLPAKHDIVVENLLKMIHLTSSPSSGGSPGPVQSVCAQLKWPKSPIIR